MRFSSLSFRRIAHTSRLFADYIEQASGVTEFFAAPPTLQAARTSARRTSISESTRDNAVKILRGQNARWTVSPQVEKSLHQLAKGAVAVVTGQQVGLFGGPAYAFYKALTAIRVSEELRRAGVEAVPIFWLASEDHDLVEVIHTWWLCATGLRRLELTVEELLPGRSVGNIKLGAEISALVNEAGAQLDGPAAEFIRAALQNSYLQGETLSGAFAKLMAPRFAEYGMLFLDPLDARWQQLASPIYRECIEKSSELASNLLKRNKELERAGYHAQVKVTESSTPLFLRLNGKRVALRRRHERFEAGGQSFSREELLKMLDSVPEDFSANALLRPVVQDFLLPTAAMVAGPAEIAYLAQSRVLYQKLGVHMPVVLPRASFTLLEPQVRRALQKYGLSAQAVIEQGGGIRRTMEHLALSARLIEKFDDGEAQLQQLLRGLRNALLRVDKTLGGAVDTAERKMLYQLLKLRAKAGRARDLRSGVLDRHERLILDSLYPHRGLQERSLNLLPFLARHGMELLADLRKHSKPFSATHQIVEL